MPKTFAEPPPKVSFPQLEREILEFWAREGIFEKARRRNARGPRFVFLEGPPTANGMPHIGHARGRAAKDAFLRYRLMSGYYVTPYIAGWDCHGLPVEIEVEKANNIASKNDIAAFGVGKFNALCKESVFRYEALWRQMSERIGFWIDLDHAYVTLEPKYIESVWWSLKQLYESKMLERGHYVVPYCTRCGTPLSSHEVAQGYEDVKELSVTLKFRLAEPYAPVGANGFILAWTTTPWTLPGNVALAVGEEIMYAIVQQGSERYVLANDLVEKVIVGDYDLVGTIKGKDMVGWKYEPLFDFMDLREPGKRAYEVIAADFVTTTEGTGVVHTAVMYGEDDYKVGMKAGLAAKHTVDTEGKFNDLVKPWVGRYVKEKGFDLEIATWLYDNGRLYAKGSYTHTYPFCWRCDSPLLYYALDSWFVRMSRIRDEMLANNEQINWVPGHLKRGRFGNFLEELKDWAVSRNRFWGTPLPVWRCAQGHEICVGSFEELGKLCGGLPKGFDPHRPTVDELKVKCPQCGEQMVREPYVIDCWYDAGSAFFAQFHYPFENREEFEKSFPVDFITEAIDQTRGWFYTLLAIGVSVFHKPTYRNVLTQEHVLDDQGQKMSKSRGNAINPQEVFDSIGADTVRLFYYSIPLWNSLRFSRENALETYRRDINTLWNVYSFFMNNAGIDGFEPPDAKELTRLELAAQKARGMDGQDIQSPEQTLNELDKWLLSRLSGTIQGIKDGIEAYELHRSAGAISDFIDDLSNWYLRRSRRRFWSETDPEDKAQAYGALYKALTELSKAMAPFTPFQSEYMYQNLVHKVKSVTPESVHLCDYPVPGPRDERLEKEMALAISVAVAGRNARQKVNIKLRQPLQQVIVACSAEDAALLGRFADILKEELNIKELTLTSDPTVVSETRAKPNFKSIGAKFKKDSKAVADAIAGADATALASALKADGKAALGGFDLSPDDVIIESADKAGYSGSEWKGLKVYVTTEIDEKLMYEGLSREIVRRVQMMRKEMALSYDRHVEIWLSGGDELDKAAQTFADYIRQETLADSIIVGKGEGDAKEWDVGDRKLSVWLRPVGQ
ncbi:MAG: isoleucine--tRNA ligase [Euryarchaeota archaeon]|nr:isoleucine--tRNA ligase [Euryarchaeota archaeon]